jgi:hypothetical protein
MVVQGKTNQQGRKGQSGTASNKNKTLRSTGRASIARRGRTYGTRGATGGGLAAATGRGKKSRK